MTLGMVPVTFDICGDSPGNHGNQDSLGFSTQSLLRTEMHVPPRSSCKVPVIIV
jgi:hypothetical protein